MSYKIRNLLGGVFYRIRHLLCSNLIGQNVTTVVQPQVQWLCPFWPEIKTSWSSKTIVLSHFKISSICIQTCTKKQLPQLFQCSFCQRCGISLWQYPWDTRWVPNGFVLQWRIRNRYSYYYCHVSHWYVHDNDIKCWCPLHYNDLLIIGKSTTLSLIRSLFGLNARDCNTQQTTAASLSHKACVTTLPVGK